MADVGVTWVQGEQFVASGTGGHSIVLDAPGGRDSWQGFKPSELLLAALAGCTAVDVIDILRKKRLHVSGLCVTVHGGQREEHPAEHRALLGRLLFGAPLDGGAGHHAADGRRKSAKSGLC